MLLNDKAEKLSKYSKLDYVPEKFIEKAKELWEYSDLQIRCIYLISDLAKRGKGVFSIAHSTFKDMFEQRFKTSISLSSVKRFFKLMAKLELLSIHEAKRKNEQQSANIYIIEQQLDELPQETPIELPSETQNTSFQEVDDKQNHKQNTVNNCLTNEDVEHEEILHTEYIYARKNGISKSLFLKVINQIKSKSNIRSFVSYVRKALDNIIHITNPSRTALRRILTTNYKHSMRFSMIQTKIFTPTMNERKQVYCCTIGQRSSIWKGRCSYESFIGKVLEK